MRRRFLYLFLLACLPLLHAQQAARSEAAQEDNNLIWKVANFVIFAGGIGYAIAKFAPSFFNARSADIQKAIKDATGLKMDADLRYSEIDRKMANLSGEVAKLRADSQAEMEREHARMLAQTEEEIAYIHKSAASQIYALRVEATVKLRRYATDAALTLAESRLRERVASTDQKDLFNDFVHLVERGKN
jgi:F-type H+-transporting ATPase subunit b